MGEFNGTPVLEHREQGVSRLSIELTDFKIYRGQAERQRDVHRHVVIPYKGDILGNANALVHKGLGHAHRGNVVHDPYGVNASFTNLMHDPAT